MQLSEGLATNMNVFCALPFVRKCRIFSFLPANPLPQSQTLGGLFKMICCLSRALILASHVAPCLEMQGNSFMFLYRHRGPKTSLKQVVQTLIVWL